MLGMQRTRHTFLGALLLLSVVFLTGCGGSGPHNPFTGRWQGTFTTDNAQVGTIQLTITDEAVGTGTGTATNTTLGATATIEGTITDAGVAVLTYQYPKTPLIRGNGTLTRGSDGKLTGRIAATISGESIGYSDIVLNPQP